MSNKQMPMPYDIRVNESITQYAIRVMNERDELKQDPRLSDDPATALAAVMCRRDIQFRFGRESDSYAWLHISSGKGEFYELIKHENAQYDATLTANDITPCEPQP